MGTNEPAEPLPSGPLPTIADRLSDQLTRIEDMRGRPSAVVVAVALGLVAVVVVWFVNRPNERPPVEALIPTVEVQPIGPSTTEMVPQVVHVTGAVASPGVYELAPGDRVLDAVELAGGPLVDADLQQLNLAAEVSDGSRIQVPFEGEVLPPEPTVDAVGPVDLNRAGVEGLDRLPGIGPSTAAAIVAHRDEFGPFRSAEDLLDVPGIGPSKLEALREEIVIR